MNKDIVENPQAPGFKLHKMHLNDAERLQWQDTGIHAPPAGFRSFIRLTDSLLEVGVEPIPTGQKGAVLPAKGDDLDGKSLAELQQAATFKNITYPPKANAVEIRQLIRAKA